MLEQSTPKRKLIEVALPLEAINRESAREKSIRHGHPSTLHLWWARRPLATARAVLFAQLVDDPSARPEEFPTEDLQRVERERLHSLIERLAVWENAQDDKLLAEAHAEILKSTNGNPPEILDPFAGGGTIPLEAQRLGLVAHASDLNPVAVLINKVLLEIPQVFRARPPVFPGRADSEIRGWSAAEGLAADVRAYGTWVRDEARKRLDYLYPEATLRGGSKATVIAWVWARTVECVNPACSAEVPLVSSLDLGKKKGQESWIRPVVSGTRAVFEVASGKRTAESNKRGQGAKFDCWVCGAPITPDQVHSQVDLRTKPRNRMLAVVTVGQRKRVYLDATPEDEAIAASAAVRAAEIRAADIGLNAECRGTFGGNAQGKRYGFFSFADYFTDRQLVAMAEFSSLVEEAREKVRQDALIAGMPLGLPLADGGNGAAAYADAVATYLGFAVSRLSNKMSSVCSWDSSTKMEAVRSVFARQALQMTWDFAEANPFGGSGGDYVEDTAWVARVLERLPIGPDGVVRQEDARSAVTQPDLLISTDPPYYDNIVYSDLADYFYVWLRRTLRTVYPQLLSTVLVPKAEELVANPYRQGGDVGAKQFFEDGFKAVFERARSTALNDFPITVYYAFKQSESDESGHASTGWETLLDGMITSGWEITSTWPNRSELSNRMVASGANALASSIVLSLRPRPVEAPSTDRRGLIAALEVELPPALRKLQQGRIAPVDLPQAAIGPGMAVFSRYSKVIEPDGTSMTVRSALTRINEILDRVLNEQEGDFDPTTRFAIVWYRQHGYGEGKFGDADNLARARNTSVDVMDRDGILQSRAGKVQLLRPADLSSSYDPASDPHISTWEVLQHIVRALEADGIGTASRVLESAASRSDQAVESDLIRELGHLLYRVAEENSWTRDALSFNSLVTSWPEIMEGARGDLPSRRNLQSALDFTTEES
jgi:putative DNA methylase